MLVMLSQKNGSLIWCHCLPQSGTFTLASEKADFNVKELGDYVLYLSAQHDRLQVLIQKKSNQKWHDRFRISYGERAGFLDWNIDLYDTSTDRLLSQSQNEAPLGVHLDFSAYLSWIEQPMNSRQLLRSAIQQFLELLVNQTHAQGGVLIRFDYESSYILATHNMATKDAENLWFQMPEQLRQKILTSRARTILPEYYEKNMKQTQATVFVRGMQNYAGFPLLVEDQVLGILYLRFDCLVKQMQDDLARQIEQAVSLLALVLQRSFLRCDLLDQETSMPSESQVSDGRLMIGCSQPMLDTYHLIERLAPVNIPVLITGETGTGKELVAKELHRMSPRHKAPFIIVHASAFPENLVEAELFGYRKGAFTGALSDRKGLIERSHGGTLFIDEVGELPLSVQVKILRVLQEKQVTRLGDSVVREVDFRLVSATNRNLRESVASGLFREDLYYRLLGAEITLAPLRERIDDIIPLAIYFRQKFAQRHGLKDKEFTADALQLLKQYHWPGNIRELEHQVEHAFVLSDGTYIAASMFSINIANKPMATNQLGEGQNSQTCLNSENMTFVEARNQWTREFLLRALEAHQGKRNETAKALGVGERTLFRYLDQFGLKDYPISTSS